MQRHTKIYLDHFGYDTADFIPCECCPSQAQDIHHIKSRGMGGSKHRDTIDNLMALCRSCHIQYGDKKQYREYLEEVHKQRLNDHVQR